MLRIKIEYPGRSPAQSIYCCWSDSENVPISQHQWKLEVSCWKNPGSEAFLLKPPVKAGQCLCGESCHNDLGVSQTKQAGTSKRGRGREKQNSAGDEMLIFSTLVAVVVHTCHCIFVLFFFPKEVIHCSPNVHLFFYSNSKKTFVTCQMDLSKYCISFMSSSLI